MKASVPHEAPAAGWAGARQNNSGTFIEFDVPGAGTSNFQGTFPMGINGAGTVAGYYVDASYISHGFLRAKDGAIVTIDVPNGTSGTMALSINNAGAIAGVYCDAALCHGFVRSPEGAISVFDGVNAIYTAAASVNDPGAVTGFYFDAGFEFHSFLRAADGTITTIDDPNAGTGFFQGIMANAMNAQGMIAGCLVDSLADFVRSKQGVFTTPDPPTPAGFTPSCRSFDGAAPPSIGINAEGEIGGTYFERIQGNPFGGNYRGFVRARDGSYETFDAATYSPCCIWTFAIAINPQGAVVGYDNDGFNVNHGFVRDSKGNVTLLDAPNAGSKDFQGTLATAINPSGTVAGWYIDVNSAWHGFVWIP